MSDFSWSQLDGSFIREDDIIELLIYRKKLLAEGNSFLFIDVTNHLPIPDSSVG